MPLPIIIPVAAAAAAGTVGFLIGREMASSDVFLPDLEDERPECGGEGNAAPPGMTEAEALRVLELEAGAAPDEIRGAHDRLTQHLRSDRGGSGYLVELVARAKAVLLDGAAEPEG